MLKISAISRKLLIESLNRNIFQISDTVTLTVLKPFSNEGGAPPPSCILQNCVECALQEIRRRIANIPA